jgi:sugar lactone lactonase YvrE
VAADGSGNFFIADSSNNVIRRVDAVTGIIATVAGNGTFCSSSTSACGDGGLATSANLNFPQGVAVDSTGNLFIADSQDYRIRRVDAATDIITTVAGNGTQGFSGDGGPATSASLSATPRVAVDDATGNLFIADSQDYRIRRVDAASGIITTVAGNGTQGFGGDGGPATSAELSSPRDLVVDRSGDIFIDDSGNDRIRRVDASTGTIATVAGNGIFASSGDEGPATSASLELSKFFVSGAVALARYSLPKGLPTASAR